MKEEKFLHTRAPPHRRGQREASEPQRATQQARRSEGKLEKIHHRDCAGWHFSDARVSPQLSRRWAQRLSPWGLVLRERIGVDCREGTLGALTSHCRGRPGKMPEKQKIIPMGRL